MLQSGHLQGFWSGNQLLTTAPSYSSAGTTGVATATPVAPTYPATLASGDMLVLIVGIAHSTSTPAVTTPSGWTAMSGASAAVSTGADRTGIAAFTKVADGTETGTFNVTITIAGGGAVAIARVYRFLNCSGVEAGGVSALWTSSLIDACLGNYGNWLPVDVTILGTKRMIVQAVLLNNDFSAGISVPSGFSSSVNATTTTASDAGIAITYKASDTSFTGTDTEIISAGGVLGQDDGDGYTVGFALIGV